MKSRGRRREGGGNGILFYDTVRILSYRDICYCSQEEHKKRKKNIILINEQQHRQKKISH